MPNCIVWRVHSPFRCSAPAARSVTLVAKLRQQPLRAACACALSLVWCVALCRPCRRLRVCHTACTNSGKRMMPPLRRHHRRMKSVAPRCHAFCRRANRPPSPGKRVQSHPLPSQKPSQRRACKNHIVRFASSHSFAVTLIKKLSTADNPEFLSKFPSYAHQNDARARAVMRISIRRTNKTQYIS